jgi:LL-diaminopimelate aminotransferase
LKKKISFEPASRIKHLPPYLFASIDRMKQEAAKKGMDIIDLSIGDPDIPTPGPIVSAMKKAVANPAHHRYPSYEGMLSYREAVARWYKKRFNTKLDARTEVLSLIGSKEGIGHIPLAFVNPGDVVLVPSPGYPVYPIGTLFAGGESFMMPLREENNFLPDLNRIPKGILQKAKLMFINYPNNPPRLSRPADFLKRSSNLRPNITSSSATTPRIPRFIMRKNHSASCSLTEQRRLASSSILSRKRTT